MSEYTLFDLVDIETQIRVNKDCVADIFPKMHLGGGSSGEIMSACYEKNYKDESKCKHIVKILNTELTEFDRDKYDREVAMTKIASKLGVGPKYVAHHECIGTDDRKYYFILTGRIDMVLGDYIELLENGDIPRDYVKDLKKVLVELSILCYQYLFYHGDLFYPGEGMIEPDINLGNIMLKLNEDKRPTRAYLIDFETSKAPADKEEIKYEWCNFFSVLSNEDEMFRFIFTQEFVNECMRDINNLK